MKRTLKIGVFVFVLLLASLDVRAETLYKLLPELILDHDRIRAAKADLEVARFGIDQSRAAYFPTLDVTADAGYEKQVKPNSAGTSTGYRELDLSATQLIWDFGKTQADVEQATLGAKKAEAQLRNIEQNIILEAVSAYLGIIRAYETLGYAKQSEASIMKLTGLEESRVERGFGLATDILQAKSQLVGAQSTKIQADGALANARNRFRAVFNKEPGPEVDFPKLKLPLDLVPHDLDEAIALAIDNNLELVASKLEIEIAKQAAKSSESSMYYPTLEGTGEIIHKHNAQGVLDTKVEKKVYLELTYSLYAGGLDKATYDAALESQKSAQYSLNDLERSIRERVQNAWVTYEISKKNAQFLSNQADIAWEFLSLARKERQLGKRSLNDLLTGEVNYINSISAAVASETDMAIAVYNLLFSMSSLNTELFNPASSTP